MERVEGKEFRILTEGFGINTNCLGITLAAYCLSPCGGRWRGLPLGPLSAFERIRFAASAPSARNSFASRSRSLFILSNIAWELALGKSERRMRDIQHLDAEIFHFSSHLIPNVPHQLFALLGKQLGDFILPHNIAQSRRDSGGEAIIQHPFGNHRFTKLQRVGNAVAGEGIQYYSFFVFGYYLFALVVVVQHSGIVVKGRTGSGAV